MNRLFKSWDRYWFPERPVFPLAIARIVLVGAQLILLFVDSRPLDRFVSLGELPYAYDPLLVIRALSRLFGAHCFPTAPVFHFIFWATVAAGVLALVGLFTHLALGIFTVGNVFLLGFLYCFGPMDHGDAVMMIALTTLTLSPCAKVLSVDAFRRRGSDHASQPPGGWRDVQSHFAQWPFLFWTWILSFVYLSAVYFKWIRSGVDWANGFTLQYYLLSDGLQHHVPLGIWMSTHHTLAVLMSLAALAFEAGFFLTIFVPALGWLFFPAGALFHLGIWFSMGADFWEAMTLLSLLTMWLVSERRRKWTIRLTAHDF